MTSVPMQGWMTSMYPHFENPEVKIKVEGLAVDYNFIKTMGIPVIAGREFSEDFGSDMTQLRPYGMNKNQYSPPNSKHSF